MTGLRRLPDRGARRGFPRLAILGCALAALASPLCLAAQETPRFVVDEDCQVFDIAADHSIVYAAPRIKRVQRLILERDDIGVAAASGKGRRIVDADKFMPVPPVQGYQVDALSWSPDGQRIAVSITLQKPPANYLEETKRKKDKDENRDSNVDMLPVAGAKAVALLDAEGHEIRVAGSKERFIENAADATWLADGATAVYLSGSPSQIVRVRPGDGQTTTLFQGHSFDTVIWDARRNRAFAIGKGLSLRGGLALVELDLLHELVTEIAQLDKYDSALSISPSGTKVGFFEDGDTIEIIDIARRSQPVRVRAGKGRFEWSRDERSVLLKRGPPDRSGDLVWVGLYDGTFTPLLHGLAFHDFQIAPGGESVAVTMPGRRTLKVYALP